MLNILFGIIAWHIALCMTVCRGCLLSTCNSWKDTFSWLELLFYNRDTKSFSDDEWKPYSLSYAGENGVSRGVWYINKKPPMLKREWCCKPNSKISIGGGPKWTKKLITCKLEMTSTISVRPESRCLKCILTLSYLFVISRSRFARYL